MTTFEYNGSPQKNVPLWSFARTAEEVGGLLVQFQKAGDYKYGPAAVFLIDGDFDGNKPREYWLKLTDKDRNTGQQYNVNGWEQIVAAINGVAGQWVQARASQGSDGVWTLDLQNQDGVMVEPPPPVKASGSSADASARLDRWLEVARIVDARTDLPSWVEKQALTTHIVLG